MLAKTNRLSRKDFLLAKKSSKKIVAENLVVYYSPSDHFRASVVIGKKLAKKAVVRNRIRRLIYAYLQTKFLIIKYNLIILPQSHEITPSSLDQVLSKLS